MKNLLYKLCTISLFLAFSSQILAQTPKQRQKAKAKGTTSLPYGFYEYLPSNYSSASKLPVVIFFSGINERGNGTSQLPYVLRQGPPKMVNQGKDFPFILISPQHPNGWWNGTSINTLIDYVVTHYKVDPARIYVTGLSAGGYGTWEAGQSASNRVAAIVPICGCGSTAQAAKMKNLAIWAFHNDKDMVVNPICSINMVNAVKAAGGKPKLTMYKNYAHDSWTKTYNNQEMWDWLLSQRKGSVPATTTNKTPIVNAGSDKTITLPTNSISLSSTSSDPDGSISSRVWKKTSGPAATLSGTTTATLKATKMVAGSYVFRLTVKDNKGATAYNDVKVTVKPKAATVSNLVVKAGSDKTITLPSNTLSITASASGTKGKINYALWKKVSGPSATMTNTTQPTLKLSKLVAGTYVFGITVKDNLGAQDYDEVKVIVKKASGGSTSSGKLIANAGTDKVITLPSNALSLSVKATGSKGRLTYCLWKKVSGPSATMKNTGQTTLKLSKLVAGTYVFGVTIKDNLGAKDYDEVKVTVKAGSNAPLPITSALSVSAGADKVVTLPTNTLKLSASGSTKAGKITYALWQKKSGPSVKMANYTQMTTTLSKLVAGTYVFRVTIKNNLGMSEYDDVKVTVRKSSSARFGDDEVLVETTEPEINLYPNPTADRFNLTLGNEEEVNLQVMVIDSKDGAIVRNREMILAPGTQPEIDVADLAPGVYFVKIITDGKEKVLRLIKI